jgi:hypothetical protein
MLLINSLNAIDNVNHKHPKKKVPLVIQQSLKPLEDKINALVIQQSLKPLEDKINALVIQQSLKPLEDKINALDKLIKCYRQCQS